MATVTQDFESAPLGRRVVLQMIFGIGTACMASVIGAVVAFQAQARHHQGKDWVIAFIGPVLGFVVAVPLFFMERSRVSRFRIEENILVLSKQKYPLEGLVSVERDPEVLRRARRTLRGGNSVFRSLATGSNFSGKLSSIQGTFKSKKTGKFYAFLTGTENAVVLRWPDKAVAVSPADPEFFIYMVRSAAGLR
jgi:hypothetical protein